MAKPSDVKSTKQTLPTKDSKPTFTKAGPNSRSGGRNKGQNGANRITAPSVLEQRRQDALVARQERELAREQEKLDFRLKQAELATKLVTDTTEFRGRKVSDDMRLGAFALIANFPHAEPVMEGKKVVKTRTAMAEEWAAMGMSDAVVLKERRFNDVQFGFRIAREFLPKAYAELKSPQHA